MTPVGVGGVQGVEGGVCWYFAVARKLSAPYVEIWPPKDKKGFFFFLSGENKSISVCKVPL